MAHVVSFRTLNDDPIAADNVEIKLKTEGDEPAFSIRGQTSTSTGPSGQPLASTNLSLINAASLTAHRLQGEFYSNAFFLANHVHFTDDCCYCVILTKHRFAFLQKGSPLRSRARLTAKTQWNRALRMCASAG